MKSPTRFMPYCYVGVIVIILWTLDSRLLFGPGAIAARFATVVPFALVAFGQSLVLVTRGIDLSVGGVASLTSAIVATQFERITAVHVIVLIIGGALIASLNGVLIAKARFQPLIVTLATWSIWGGVAFQVLSVDTVMPTRDLTNLVTGDIGGVPKGMLAVTALFVIWVYLRGTALFRDLVAVGSDTARATLNGVRVTRATILAYTISGACATAAALWITGQNNSASPTMGDQLILGSIVAVVLGGMSLFGGGGSAASSMIGAIALIMIPDVIFALKLTSSWTVLVQGVVLIASVLANSVVEAKRTIVT